MRYSRLRSSFPDLKERRRVVGHLIALREQLASELPSRDAEENLLLATWNIRDLGKAGGGWGYGPRLEESLFYIAEILSRFDFVAVQEINELEEWARILDILGPHYEFIASDVTDRALGGNGERLTYLYDTRKVSFRNIVGELVLPPAMLVSSSVVEREEDQPASEDLKAPADVGRQFARTPYLASFRSGWLKFDICTVHIYYGEESGEGLRRRIDEIRKIARYFGRRAERALAEDKSLILLGDFNVVEPEHETMEALLEAGFEVPEALRHPSNVGRSKYYDQIAFRTRPGLLDYLGSGGGHAGVFDIYEHLFTPEQRAEYEADAEPWKEEAERNAAEEARRKGKNPPPPQTIDQYYLDWRTWQLSDHLPMWVQLRVNDSSAYLEREVFEG